jgi:transcriptional regulator with XRE-family HTH domain
MLLVVEWKQIRAAFIRARGARNQDEIATASGLHQSAISKLESNDNLGPAVETFVKAIQGLGMSPSAFFARIEGVPAPAPSKADEGLPAIVPIDQITERVVQTLAELLALASERADEGHHRPTPGPRPTAADGPTPRRVRARGAAQRKTKLRRRRKG